MDYSIEREAMFYEQLDNQQVRCLLCPHCCLLKVGETGTCRGRKNITGKLIAINYGRTMGISLDPIEKKPLYHFRPGSQIVSLGPNSCNLSCFFCQNYDSSQMPCSTVYINPEQLYNLVLEHSYQGYKQVAFTYTEPFTWYEYIYDFAKIARDTDIVMVTNGYINPAPLKELMPYIRAMNIDLKSIRNEFYVKHCNGGLETVKQTIKNAFNAGIHIELTNLLIPTLNDAEEDIQALIDFVSSISVDIPLHFSAYYPAYKSNIPPTSPRTVLKACQMAKEKLSYVYAGNIWSDEFRETYCPKCDNLVISAHRRIVGIDDKGQCRNCSYRIYGVF